MGLTFVAPDMPVFPFVASKLARHVAKPKVGMGNRLQRCVRYIHGHSGWIQNIPILNEVHSPDVHTDSDWAKDQDRKSVSCVVTMMSTHCLRVHVTTQTAPETYVEQMMLDCPVSEPRSSAVLRTRCVSSNVFGFNVVLVVPQ